MGGFMLLKELGDRLRFLRKQTGLSQERFALKIGMDRTYYASVENGKRNISILNLNRIADGLDISLSEILCFDRCGDNNEDNKN